MRRKTVTLLRYSSSTCASMLTSVSSFNPEDHRVTERLLPWLHGALAMTSTMKGPLLRLPKITSNSRSTLKSVDLCQATHQRIAIRQTHRQMLRQKVLLMHFFLSSPSLGEIPPQAHRRSVLPCREASHARSSGSSHFRLFSWIDLSDTSMHG